MPRRFSVRGRASYGLARCDRCGFNYRIGDIKPDGNVPGLMVCNDCWDPIDGNKLPMKPADDITLPFVRPDN